LDKIRQEKLKRFRESIINKLSINDENDFKNEDNRTLFNISWKDNGEFQSDDLDYQRYLRTLNAAIFLRIKSLCERHIDLSISNHLKHFEKILYNETLVHLTYYSKLSSCTCLGFENFVENNKLVKQWLSLANTTEHHPLMIIGNRASGKTLLCTKLVQYLLNILGKNTQCIIRYFNLTSKSRNILELFTSICKQMSTLQNVPTLVNDQQFNQIEYYQSVLTSLSKNQKPIIIMIDGIEEATPTSQYTSSIVYYQTLLQALPPKVFTTSFFSITIIQLSEFLC
jgi:Cdc6-like AAA superfamily ATPase